MLGAVGYSPVVSPHRIKQVCQPYQVVKVATECGLLARSTNEVWRRGKTVMIPLYFRLCYVFSCRSKSKKLICSLLLCQNTDGDLCTDIKASVTKKECQVNTVAGHAKGIDLTIIYPKGINSLFGHQKFVRGSSDTFASEPVV